MYNNIKKGSPWEMYFIVKAFLESNGDSNSFKRGSFCFLVSLPILDTVM